MDENAITVTESHELVPCWAIRRAVFVAEQGIAEAEEIDGKDGDCRQYLAWRNGYAVGTARLRSIDAATAKIERMAVLAVDRRRGVGRALLERMVADASGGGAEWAVLHAQSHAEGFYRRLGFAVEGEPFEEAGIPHLRMIRHLK